MLKALERLSRNYSQSAAMVRIESIFLEGSHIPNGHFCKCVLSRGNVLPLYLHGNRRNYSQSPIIAITRVNSLEIFLGHPLRKSARNNLVLASSRERSVEAIAMKRRSRSRGKMARDPAVLSRSFECVMQDRASLGACRILRSAIIFGVAIHHSLRKRHGRYVMHHDARIRLSRSPSRDCQYLSPIFRATRRNIDRIKALYAPLRNEKKQRGKKEGKKESSGVRDGNKGDPGIGGQITMSTGVARAWVPRRKSAHVPLAAASFSSDRFNDRYRRMIDAPARRNGSVYIAMEDRKASRDREGFV